MRLFRPDVATGGDNHCFRSACGWVGPLAWWQSVCSFAVLCATSVCSLVRCRCLLGGGDVSGRPQGCARAPRASPRSKGLEDFVGVVLDPYAVTRSRRQAVIVLRALVRSSFARSIPRLPLRTQGIGVVADYVLPGYCCGLVEQSEGRAVDAGGRTADVARVRALRLMCSLMAHRVGNMSFREVQPGFESAPLGQCRVV